MNTAEWTYIPLYPESRGSEKDLLGFRYPSPTFLKIFSKIFEFSTEVLPTFCCENQIKETITKEVKKRIEEEEIEREELYDFDELGCA